MVLLAAALAACGDRDAPTPSFFARTLDRETYTAQSLAGHPVLIQFWATWCPKCRGDQPAVDAIARDFSARGLVVLAVDIGEPRRTVESYLRSSPRLCKVILNDETDLASTFSSGVVPQYVMIGADGKVAGTQTGARGEAALRSLIGRAGLQ